MVLMLVAPTEPKRFHRHGQTSFLPETFGADFLLVTGTKKVGVQRKEVVDLVASLRDGRLAKELLQLRQLDQGILLVEGDWDWSRKGVSRRLQGRNGYGPEFTISQFNGVQLSAQVNGIWTVSVPDARGTELFLDQLPAWLERDNHLSLLSRPKAPSKWGHASSDEWAGWVWQSFEGVGPRLSQAIVEVLGLPLVFTCTEQDLLRVPGIGKVRARAIMAALDYKRENPDGIQAGSVESEQEAVDGEATGTEA